MFVWMLIVERPRDWLLAHSVAFAEETGFEDGEILVGAGSWSAVASQRPGSEGVDTSLAVHLSDAGAEVYAVRFGDDLASVRRFANGSHAGDVDSAPYEFAADHGFNLGVPVPVRARSALVVEGATPAEAAAALGLGPDDAGGALHVTAASAGALVYNDNADVTTLLRPLARALPDKTVYLLSHLAGSHFVAQAVRGDTDVGVIYDPPHLDPTLPTLGAICGETAADRIAHALGVPLSVLELG